MTVRLPIPGSDDGTWGTILNSFLDVSHNDDGTPKVSALQAAGVVTSINSVTPQNGNIDVSPSAIGAYNKPSTGIPVSDLESSVQSSLQVASALAPPPGVAVGSIPVVTGTNPLTTTWLPTVDLSTLGYATISEMDAAIASAGTTSLPTTSLIGRWASSDLSGLANGAAITTWAANASAPTGTGALTSLYSWLQPIYNDSTHSVSGLPAAVFNASSMNAVLSADWSSSTVYMVMRSLRASTDYNNYVLYTDTNGVVQPQISPAVSDEFIYQATSDPTVNVGDTTTAAVTLSQALSTAAAITSLPVTTLSSAIVEGNVTVISGANTQTFTCNQPVSSGATSIPISSATPNFAYPTSSTVTAQVEGSVRLSLGTTHLVTMVVSESSNGGLSIDGGTLFSGATIPPSTTLGTQFNLASYNGGYGKQPHMELIDLLVYDTIHSQITIDEVHNYLRSLYSLSV